MSDLGGLMADLFGRVIGVFDMGMGTRTIWMLDKDVKIILFVHKDLILDDTSFL
jgi:hypothetical protein